MEVYSDRKSAGKLMDGVTRRTSDREVDRWFRGKINLRRLALKTLGTCGAPPTSNFDIFQTPIVQTSTPHNTANMPQQVSDIKQFIEIARRKDASC